MGMGISMMEGPFPPPPTSVLRVSPAVVIGRPPPGPDEVGLDASHLRVVRVSHRIGRDTISASSSSSSSTSSAADGGGGGDDGSAHHNRCSTSLSDCVSVCVYLCLCARVPVCVCLCMPLSLQL